MSLVCRKKGLYLSWAENHGLNPLIKNQIISQVSNIKMQGASWDIDLILATPLFSKKSIMQRSRYITDIRSLHEEVRLHNVRSYQKWIWAPSTFFHSHLWQFLFLYIFDLLPLTFFLRRKKYDVIHCRSYHSTLAALFARKIGRLHCKVIFDTRGLFPEESVYQHHFKQKSLSFKMWKVLEKWALSKADCIVNVSAAFSDHIRYIVPDHSNIQTIYTTANASLFKKSKPQMKKKGPSKDECFVIGYLGVLGPQSWYSTERLAHLTLEAQHQLGSARLKIITRSNHTVIKKELNEAGLASVDIDIVQTSNADETAAALAEVNVATVPVRSLNSELDRLLMQVLIGAKTAEYLANGLPLIAYQEASSIAQLVEEHGLGQVAKENEISSLDFRDFFTNEIAYQVKAKDFAFKNFGASNNAKKYITIYENMLLA